MLNESFHATDEELLLAADGELPARRATEVRAHLAACWDCRARMAETERAIAEFSRAYRQTLDLQLPAIAGPRALLKVQLADLSGKRESRSRQKFFQFSSTIRAAAYICASLLLVALVGRLFIQRSSLPETSSAADSFESGAVPNRSLTPGSTRRVTISDVCSMPHEEVVRNVSNSMRQQVFREYGIVQPNSDDYEIDYLIAPGLGGVEDIHNLWPEPYTSSKWNAHVKDALEEQLHEMVCAGKLNLSTAQRDIATDWIAAYKKYFHTDEPLSTSSDLTQTPELLIPASSIRVWPPVDSSPGTQAFVVAPRIFARRKPANSQPHNVAKYS